MLEPSTALTTVGLLIGAVIGADRHLHRVHAVGAADPSCRPGCSARFAPLHRLFVNKWYFDEAIDLLIVPAVRLARPLRRAPRSSASSWTARWSAARPASSGSPPPACARVQTGYLRYYAALLLLGVTSLGAYFLISA